MTTQQSKTTLATNATITPDAILIDGKPLPFAVSQAVSVVASPHSPGVNQIQVEILVNGPVVLQGDRRGGDAA